MHRVLLCILALCVGSLLWVILTFVTRGRHPRHSGAIPADLPSTAYGFGPRSQRVLINITAIGSVPQIDLSDKQYAVLTWSDNETTATYPIGIEIKGSGLDERPKLNYAFEIWEAADSEVPCTSAATCDDTKEELFQFGEKYEDYVLRGGGTSRPLCATSSRVGWQVGCFKPPSSKCCSP